jgi:RNA polymerase sigma-70 factor (ECF subfamily)
MTLNNPAQRGQREQDLILHVQRGQHELFYELVRPYERRVYAAALAILRNEQDAEDAAQEAMLKAFANIRQFRAEARFSTWLIQITVNEALMRRRRERTVHMEGLDGHRSGEEQSEYAPRDFADWREIPSEALERKEVRQRLAEALGTLDRKYREVFVLRDMEHLNIQETANALGITVASVKTRLLRARLMLRELLAAGWEQGWYSRLPFEKGNKPW